MNAITPHRLLQSTVPNRVRPNALWEPRVGAAGVRVLLAEHSRPVRRTLARRLELDGHLVWMAATGAELLAAVSDWVLGLAPASFDVIITARRLPTFDPISIVEGLRALGWDAPILVLSEPQDEADTEQHGSLGGVDVVQREACPEAIASRLRALRGPSQRVRRGS